MTRSAPAVFVALQRPGEKDALGVRERIYRACYAALADGSLPPGARLPSARQLAAEWGVARSTVDEAIAELQAHGWLVRRVGDGTYVAAQPDRKATPSPHSRRGTRRTSRAARAALANVSPVSRDALLSARTGTAPRPQAFVAGLPALDAFPLALWRRLTARRMRVSGAALLGYVPPLGHLPLREATARHLRAARGIECEAGQVMILNSAMQALDLVARVLLEPGDRAFVEDPGYPGVRAILAMAGARVTLVPLDAEGLDLSAGVRRAGAPRLLCVTPSCQYPSGIALSLARRLALLHYAHLHGAWIVEDDYQCEFTYAARPIAPMRALDRGGRTLYVGTFTDAVFPSLRIAYLVLPVPLVETFVAVRRQLDDHTHGLMQAVLADFIDGGHFAAHLRRMRTLYSERRDALVNACASLLPAYACLGPADRGMNAALHLPARLADTEIAHLLRERGIVVMPLSRYAGAGGRVNGLLLGYTALPPRAIRSAVRKLADVLAAAG